MGLFSARGFAALLASALSLALAACASVPEQGGTRLAPIEQALSRDIAFLASDELEGRQPGTEGARHAQDYIVEQLRAAGYRPGVPVAGGGDGWRQRIELVRFDPGELHVTLTSAHGSLALSDRAVLSGPQTTVGSIRKAPLVAMRSTGEVLPEGILEHRALLLAWDKLDGRLAAVQTAAPQAVLLTTRTPEEFDRAVHFLRADKWALASTETVPAWILLPPKDSARLMSFVDTARPERGGSLLPRLGARVDIDFTRTRKAMETANILGHLPGTRPGSGAVLLLAHWDHLGMCGEPEDAHRICNGAVDNASGVAAMLETARRVAAAGPLERDLYVLATGAEEWGLLGARAFTDDPPVPLPTIVAAFNMDMPAISPAGSSETVIGWGRTGLDDGIAQVAEALGLTLDTQNIREDYLRRQDGWALLERDLPAVMVTSAYGDREAFDRFIASGYHTPNDRWSPDMELGGAAQDVLFHVALLRHFGNTQSYRVGQE
ncbi:M20/M25/M40 family metallo-hydrolase [Erythrobacter sp. LQ02-29]|uniref:M20/M25/M40 family metallo-hydrolase n=1 Tax=Erythrobacter sp. LQ02-29 TaxID=2920384 RepID=UPI001F4E40E9|nr:M20/M25/M40 family metallo-hydrolase [Erythrobacter sp. LQ02-29]MCP9223027.1 M20/M25/M40 family metallo-hydrolase [Erythrobacter sp. LQ02-29]